MRVVDEPETEPVTLEEAKLFLRVDIDDDDDLITSLITVARCYAEEFTRRAFVTQTLAFDLDEWPSDDIIRLPRLPVESVDSITYLDEDGDGFEFEDFVSDIYEGVVTLEADGSWPTETLYPLAPITVEFTAGYGEAAAVPEGLKTAIKIIVAQFYENREPVAVGTIASRIPMSVESLLWQYRNLKAVS